MFNARMSANSQKLIIYHNTSQNLVRNLLLQFDVNVMLKDYTLPVNISMDIPRKDNQRWKSHDILSLILNTERPRAKYFSASLFGIPPAVSVWKHPKTGDRTVVQRFHAVCTCIRVYNWKIIRNYIYYKYSRFRNTVT